MEQILIANPGSTSRKYALYLKGEEIVNAVFRIHGQHLKSVFFIKGKSYTIQFEGFGLDSALSKFMHIVQNEHSIVLIPKAIALRIVAAGKLFQRHLWLDESALETLKKQQPWLPLHIPTVLAEYDELKKAFPDTGILGVSDSAFHANQSSELCNYGTDGQLTDGLEVKKYGFHGIAAISALHQLAEIEAIESKKIVLCHLGGGSSITAIERGGSIYTSMGFSPLEGPMMVHRSGSIDPAAMTRIIDEFKSSKDAIIYLNTKCGLAAWAGSNDISLICKQYTQNHPESVAAIDKYVSDTCSYIGIATMHLQGLDVIVFSGGIGENAVLIRDLILEKLKFLGFEQAIESEVQSEKITRLSSQNSKTKAYAIRVDEEKEMADILVQMAADLHK